MMLYSIINNINVIKYLCVNKYKDVDVFANNIYLREFLCDIDDCEPFYERVLAFHRIFKVGHDEVKLIFDKAFEPLA